MDPDPPHARLGQLPGDAFGHLFRVAVHRAVGHDRARFAFVAAQTVVHIYHAGNLALPDGAVRRADGPDRKSADLLQRLLHGDAVFAHYAGVVAAHLVPVAFRFDLRIGDAAVEGAERAERVARENDPLVGIPRHHRLRPVDHRDQVEREHLAAQIERRTLPDLDRPRADAVVAADHLERLGVADDPQVGVAQPQGRDRRGVVGFHVVHHEVVDLPLADHFADVLEQAAAESLLHGVDEGDLLADDQIGVVRNPRRKRPEPFEAGGGAVVYADVMDAGQNFRDSHISLSFLVSAANLRKKTPACNRGGIRPENTRSRPAKGRLRGRCSSGDYSIHLKSLMSTMICPPVKRLPVLLFRMRQDTATAGFSSNFPVATLQ